MSSGDIDHIVKLDERSCTCGKFQSSGIPCKHAIRLANEARIDPATLVDTRYSAQSYQSRYQVPVPTIAFDRLPMDNSIVPMPPKRGRGRPQEGGRVSRVELAMRRRQPARDNTPDPTTVATEVQPAAARTRRCGLCGATGHYRSTCSTN